MSLHALVEKWRADADRFEASSVPGDGLIAAARRNDANELAAALAGGGEVVGYIAQYSIDALNACRNDEHNGYANIWMRPRDSETIPLFTHPAGAVQVTDEMVERALSSLLVREIVTNWSSDKRQRDGVRAALGAALTHGGSRE